LNKYYISRLDTTFWFGFSLFFFDHSSKINPDHLPILRQHQQGTSISRSKKHDKSFAIKIDQSLVDL
jgi:hypothetical protein